MYYNLTLCYIFLMLEPKLKFFTKNKGAKHTFKFLGQSRIWQFMAVVEQLLNNGFTSIPSQYMERLPCFLIFIIESVHNHNSLAYQTNR